MNNYFKLQNVLFCEDDKIATHWKMFFHGSQPAYDRQNRCIVIGAGQVVDFCTYFNSIALRKWRTYTWADKLILKLRVQGKMEICLTGYEKEDNRYIRRIVARKKIIAEEEKEIRIPYPDKPMELAGFEVHALEHSTIFEGEYGTEVQADKRTHVSLHLVTTTFKKEEYILPNIELLKKTVLTEKRLEEISDRESLAKNFWIHVVDNGRTLSPEQIEADHVQLHPNLNTGGAGGFTRGMLESLEHREKPTNVLLMDDDVLVLPESIIRTYQLLRIQRPEYKRHFISGAMLYYEEMEHLHEDVGYVNRTGEYGPLKPRINTARIEEVLRREEQKQNSDTAYAGWWYCCIPVEFVRKDNLPLPFFIRGDDVEYSLRNKAEFITMNGICIWHKGFSNKFNGAMEFYQVHRNSLILQAASGVCRNIDFMDRISKLVRVNLLRFNYDGAEQLLDAVEDYLKGYHFLMKNQGEKLMKEESSKNEKLISLEHFPEAPMKPYEVYNDPPRKALETFLYRLTYNGHFWPSWLLKKQAVPVAYDWFYSPHLYFFRRKLLVVNPAMETGAYREMDRKRFIRILRRKHRIMKQYKETHTHVEREFREHRDEMTSESFWRKYLEIDQK